jgi:hypothetical protein
VYADVDIKDIEVEGLVSWGVNKIKIICRAYRSPRQVKADIAYRSLSRKVLPGNFTLQAFFAVQVLCSRAPHQLAIFVEGTLETIN